MVGTPTPRSFGTGEERHSSPATTDGESHITAPPYFAHPDGFARGGWGHQWNKFHRGFERLRLSVALMWDSPSVVAGEEGRSSPVPNDRRGRRPHHSGVGLLGPVIPPTCATVSLSWYTAAPVTSASDGESDGILDPSSWIISYDTRGVRRSIADPADRAPAFGVATVGHGTPPYEGGSDALVETTTRVRS